MLLLFVPWFLTFVAMLGLCCFLRACVTGWTRPTPLMNPHEQQPAIQATKTFKKHFGAGDTISDHDKPTQKAHSLNTAEPSTQDNDCRCFRSFVFLGGARRLELSPCDTRQCAYHMNLSSCNTCNTRFGHNQSHVTTSLSTGRGPVSCACSCLRRVSRWFTPVACGPGPQVGYVRRGAVADARLGLA